MAFVTRLLSLFSTIGEQIFPREAVREAVPAAHRPAVAASATSQASNTRIPAEGSFAFRRVSQ